MTVFLSLPFSVPSVWNSSPLVVVVVVLLVVVRCRCHHHHQHPGRWDLIVVVTKVHHHVHVQCHHQTVEVVCLCPSVVEVVCQVLSRMVRTVLLIPPRPSQRSLLHELRLAHLGLAYPTGAKMSDLLKLQREGRVDDVPLVGLLLPMSPTCTLPAQAYVMNAILEMAGRECIQDMCQTTSLPKEICTALVSCCDVDPTLLS